MAEGEFLAFTDSDCVAVPRWLEAGVAAFDNRVTVVQGKTVPNPDQPRYLIEHTVNVTRESPWSEMCNVFYRAEAVRKVHEGRPNIDDAIRDGKIQLVVNTPAGKLSVTDDSYIRKSAIRIKVPYITTITAALAAAEGIAARLQGETGVKALQEYHAAL